LQENSTRMIRLSSGGLLIMNKSGPKTDQIGKL
jgi:hypothetical protein